MSGWARAVDRDRRTLWYHWQKLGPGRGDRGGDPPLSPKEFLGWIQLVRAVAARRAGRSWEAVADALRVDARTLRRRAKQLLGRPLSEAELAEDELRRGLEARVERLLGKAEEAVSDTLT